MPDYTKISPLGERVGDGTFDCFFDSKKYPAFDAAIAANDFVIVDFVQDENGIIYFEFHHVRTPEIKRYHRLEIQFFPLGVDIFDDNTAGNIAAEMYL